MNDLLEQYYEGISQQLRSEVDFINSLISHQGLKGAGNEAILRELITKFIPKRFSVGSGIVIDQYGNPSRQCDIVIYDDYFYPSLMALTSLHIYPVDIVYATIEVKTTLTSKSAKGALENIASVRSLDIIEDKFMLIESRPATSGFPNEPHIAGVEHIPSPPAGIVFAYNSSAQKAETFKEWFSPDKNSNTFHYPTMVGCLDQGIVKFQDVSPLTDTVPEAFIFPVWQDETSFVILDRFVESLMFEGRVHPVKNVIDQYALIDQSKVLLMFLLLLNEILAAKSINPTIKFTKHYLTPSMIRNISI